MPPLPPLRQVEPRQVTVEGEAMICLTDPLGYVETQLVMSAPAFFVAACLDGKRDIAAIQKEFATFYGGAQVAEAEVISIVEALDDGGFLESEIFQGLRVAAENAFRARHVRSAKLAGMVYPEEADAAAGFLDQYLQEDGGEEAGEGIAPGAERPLRGLIAPHIDFDRGGAVYGAAYRRLNAGKRPDVALLFGVAHAGASTPFVLTRKHFETPFGTLRTDQELVTLLERDCPWDPYESEMAHRMEHSLEFQAVMLGRLYGEDITIVPILCFFPAHSPDDAQEEMPHIDSFLGVCNKMVRESDRSITVIAAADLAHVGRKFGDNLDITEKVVKTVRTKDLENLAHVVTMKPESFLESVMRGGNPHHVCGIGPIYAAMKTLEGVAQRAEILGHDHAPDPEGGMVSFAALALD